MPTLIEEQALQTFDETQVEEFDLEQLARISAAEPHFETLEAAPRSRFRRTAVIALLAVAIVSGLATLRPDARAAYTPGAAQGGTTIAGEACALGE